jgi:hypothetical protein
MLLLYYTILIQYRYYTVRYNITGITLKYVEILGGLQLTF